MSAVFGPRGVLTSRELQILECAGEGMTAQETAVYLGVAPQTVKFHRTRMYKKLGARNAIHAVILGWQRRLISLPEDEAHPLSVVIDGYEYRRVEVNGQAFPSAEVVSEDWLRRRNGR